MDVIEVKSNMSTTISEISYLFLNIDLSSPLDYMFSFDSSMTAQLNINSPIL